MNKEYNTLQQAEKALANRVIPQGPSDDLIRQTLEKIENQQTAIPFMERIFKMKPFTKIAAAAIILVALSAIFLFPQGGSSIALASVYSKVQQAQAFMYQMSMSMTGMGEMMGTPEMDMTVTISEDYGMKMENHMTSPGPEGKTQNMTQLAYLLPGEKVMISIIPYQKMYQRIEFTDDLLEQSKKQNNDPREMIKQMMDCKYVELEQTEIDGIKVQGFQTTDPAYAMGLADEVTATVWVDVDTWMPVKSEIWAKMGAMESTYVIDQFQWDVPISAADFEYVIPEDYKEQGSMKMPEMTEEAAIEGLKIFKKFFGEYPEKIDLASMVPSLMKKMKYLMDDPKTEYAKEFIEKMKATEAEGDKTVMQQVQNEFTPVTGLAMFHMRLLQDKKDVAYYGDQVTPADADAVLMRWKIDKESSTYKVIFGDLTVTEMEYDKLREIEPQTQPAPQP